MKTSAVFMPTVVVTKTEDGFKIKVDWFDSMVSLWDEGDNELPIDGGEEHAAHLDSVIDRIGELLKSADAEMAQLIWPFFGKEVKGS